MNILLLIDQLQAGGAETHVLTLARALMRQGHTVTVASDGGMLAQAAVDLTLVSPPRPWSGRRFWPSLVPGLLFLRRLHKEHHFDVIHAHTRRTALLLRLFGVGVRLFPGGFLSVRAPYARSPLPYRKKGLLRADAPALVVTAHARFSLAHRRISYWGERTIAVSEDLSRHLKASFGVDPERVTVIGNGIDEERFYPDQTPPPADEWRITFASRLDADCAAAAFLLVNLFDRLREAAARRGRRLTLTIIGGGSEYATLGHRVKTLSHDGIRLVGAVCDLAPYLRRCDVFVGVSRAALEALFCGATVVLGGNEGFLGALTPENFDRAAKGNFCCRDEGALSEQGLYDALVSLLDCPREEIERRRLAFGAKLQARYGSDGIAKDTCQVYQKALGEKRRLTLLIAGYAGCGNLGDDAILRRLIARWQDAPAPPELLPFCQESLPSKENETRPRLCLQATVASPAHSPFAGIRPIARKHPLDLFRAIQRADALVLGGGCLLQNGSSRKNLSLLYYLALPVVARLARRPVYLVAGGLGPIRGTVANTVTALVLRSARRISLRDESSLALAADWEIPRERLLLEPDPVLSLQPAAKGEIEHLLRAVPSGHDFVCVVPRPTKGECHEALARSLRLLWQKNGVYPLFFAFDEGQDLAPCRDILDACGVGAICRERDERLVAALFGVSRGVISQRLHALILSSVAGAPAIALDYDELDPKLSAFARKALYPLLSADAKETEILALLRAFSG